MRKAVINFGRNSEGSDMAVVFYAGHGMEVGEKIGLSQRTLKFVVILMSNKRPSA